MRELMPAVGPVAEDLRLDQYDFELPPDQIAQQPAASRDASRLMVLDRRSGDIAHGQFRDVLAHLQPGDVLVLNDTRVIPARLRGTRATGGQVELLLLKTLGTVPGTQRTFAERWECIGKPSARIKLEQPISFRGQDLTSPPEPEDSDKRELEPTLLAFPERREGEGWIMRLEANIPILAALDAVGELPLPPYIARRDDQRNQSTDLERYQTVFARAPGSAAAPTAGLHFTPELLAEIQRQGVSVCYVTLHVGIGTFSPVRTEDISSHQMHSERWQVSAQVWEQVQAARSRGKRVIAVGTTSVRTLESLARQVDALGPPTSLRQGEAPGWTGDTTIFIYPGFSFQVVDAIITNFHLPRSSLLMLVSAFAGRQRVLNAYAEAVRAGYRFFSYGDAMWIA